MKRAAFPAARNVVAIGAMLLICTTSAGVRAQATTGTIPLPTPATPTAPAAASAPSAAIPPAATPGPATPGPAATPDAGAPSAAVSGTPTQPAAPTPGLIQGAQSLATPAIAPIAPLAPARSAAPAVPEVPDDYKINAGDVLDVQVVNLDQTPRKVRVDTSGIITLPLIGGVPVAGKSPSEVEAKIAAMLAEKYMQDPQVTVFVEDSVSQRFSIEGAVRTPNLFPLKGHMTLLQALAMGGGTTKVADLTQVRILRGTGAGMQNMVFDAEKIRDGTAQDPQIFGNDRIIVDASTAKTAFYETLDTIRGLVSFGTLR